MLMEKKFVKYIICEVQENLTVDNASEDIMQTSYYDNLVCVLRK